MPTPRQRLLYALSGALLDRPPAICLGGPMSAAVAPVLAEAGIDFAAVHADGARLAGAALAIARLTGFENVGLPLCATVEAEALGDPIDPAGARTEPRVARERWRTVDEAALPALDDALEAGRIPALLQAVAIASEVAEDLPVVANLLGPMTLAASLVEPTGLLRSMATAPARVHALLDGLDAFLATLAGRLAVAGADVVALHEDMGDPCSVGPRRFAEFTVRHLAAVVDRLRAAPAPVAQAGHEPFCACPARRVPGALDQLTRGVPLVVHCCELSEPAWPLLPGVGATAWSVGASTPVRRLREALPDLPILGNVSTFVLDRGAPEQVAAQAAGALSAGVDALAPACGLAMSTPLASIRALVAAAVSRPVHW